MKVYSVLAMESLRFYVFFLVCFYFIKKAANFLTLTNGRIEPAHTGIINNDGFTLVEELDETPTTNIASAMGPIGLLIAQS